MTTDLRAFHCKAEIKDYYLERVRKHRAADEIRRGFYWQKQPDGVFRGCAVGCTLHSSNHGAYETELGIPRILARLEDGIFEALDAERAMAWPEEFLQAIPVGADLSLVWPRFAVWMLTDDEFGVLQYAKREQSREAIKLVAEMYSRMIAGETISPEDARKIYKNAATAAAAATATAADAYAYAAYAAADAYAADAYAYAAYAAAAAAYAYAYAAAAYAYARLKVRVAQADKLLELMAAAPVSSASEIFA